MILLQQEWCGLKITDCVIQKRKGFTVWNEPKCWCLYRLTKCDHPVCIQCINHIKKVYAKDGIHGVSKYQCEHCKLGQATINCEINLTAKKK